MLVGEEHLMSKSKKTDKIKGDVMLLGGVEVDDARVQLDLVVKWKEGMFIMDMGIESLRDVDDVRRWIKRRLPEWKAMFARFEADRLEAERQSDASHETP